ncbi:glutathione peroxidase [Brumimicrobium salinarum]|uniref:Glutathione peroxidase n=1 Tax=Brumimicrobium salinarum TaxID=2058658 RepID=A0A2I0R5C4_9FLAO|nr:glutathione peroxidase [Brumimicrobium salinarum]PKR81755.1 glutathione peroxidase [Brumimicrobium salinarum]
MIKNTFITLIGLFLFSFVHAQDIYKYEVETIDGKSISLSKFRGKKIMIVNTASKCGFTPQYEDLQNLYETYKDKGFVILGFPSNDFMKQEPGTDQEIATFCEKNYGVTFPMMSKVSVKGEKQIPLYQFLTRKELNGHSDSNVKWNFQKYLVNEEGKLESVYYSKTNPQDEAIIQWIEN